MTGLHGNGLAQTLLSEIALVEQLSQSRLKRALPGGMELSHFVVLNHFMSQTDEETPAKLAKRFRVTKGAMTNTLSRLEKAGLVDIRPDWNDGRRKLVSVNDKGKAAHSDALSALGGVFKGLSGELGEEQLLSAIGMMQSLKDHFDAAPAEQS